MTFLKRTRNYANAVALTGVVVWLFDWLKPHVNLTTVALALVVAVTVCAVNWGSAPALLAALCSGLAFNYFFIPPVRTWNIADPQNWVAFSAFCATALLVGHLFARAREQAETAESRRIEIEALYQKLKEAFEEASEAESLRRSEKLKAALLDAVTHELRTPLTAIKASATTLLGATSDGEKSTLAMDARRELLEVIDEESDRLNRFVEQMMELAGLEAGHLPLRRTPTSATEIINTALDRAAAPLSHHGVEVTIEEKLPALEVDAACISNVLFELLENAAKYSPAGSAIHVQAMRARPGIAEISVEDEGAGIPTELRERVFEKFFRVAARKESTHGFGMGLAIARGIVEAHGGKIWAEGRKQGRGTAMKFTVPCGTMS